MMGTKRRSVSFRSDAEDIAFQSKRILGGDSHFQSQGLESSQNQVGAAPSLDSQRAVSSQQHVRALNTQFASWVQTQLQNHPDELWEDGVRDYLTHASNILEEFSDVVSWLKAKTANGGTLPSVKAATSEKPQDKETNNNAETARRGKPMFGAESKFAPSWNSAAEGQSPLFPWTSGGTTQNQSPSSSSASLGASINTQAAGQSTAPVFTPWSSGAFSESLLPSSGTNSTGGASSNSQVAAQVTTPITTPWTSGVFSKNQSPPSGVFSTNQPQSPGVFSTNQPPLSGVFSTNQPPSSGGFSTNQPPSSGGFSTNQPPLSSVFSTNQSPSSGVFSMNQTPSGVFSTNLSPSSGTSASAPAAASWSLGLSSNNQASLKFGSQSTAPLSEDAATNDNADDENEEQPSSPSLKKSEEKGIVVVHEVKCKLYLKSSDPADKDPWKDKGTGQLSIKCIEGVSKGAKESKPTILVRNDVGRILLNALLYPGIKTTSVKKNSIMAIFHTAVEDGINGSNSEVVARTFLIKTKNEEERNKLAEAIQENAPAA